MRVVLDARKLGDGGIGVYIENLILGLTEITSKDQLQLALLVDSKRLLAEKQVSALEILERLSDRIEIYQESAPRYSVTEYLTLAKNHRKLLEAADLFHAPHYTLPFKLGIPSVVTIHDVIHVSQPDSIYHRVIGKVLIHSAVKRASQIITVSHASVARMKRFIDRNIENITVVPNALREQFALEHSNPSPALTQLREGIGEIILFVGSDRPHKNFSALLGAFLTLHREARDAGSTPPRLVTVGNRFSLDQRTEAVRAGVSESIFFLGELSTSELAELYRLSSVVVVPSLEEGFGLVALEAMASGVSLVCTPEASMRELAGNSAWYCDGYSSTAVAGAIRAIAEHPDLASMKQEEGKERAATYTRALQAEATLEVYRAAINGQKPQFLKNPPDAVGDRAGVFEKHLRRADPR